jgi:hypothetical protein
MTVGVGVNGVGCDRLLGRAGLHRCAEVEEAEAALLRCGCELGGGELLLARIAAVEPREVDEQHLEVVLAGELCE